MLKAYSYGYQPSRLTLLVAARWPPWRWSCCQC